MSISKSIQGVVQYDDAGNPVTVVLDGSTYRLQAQTKVLNTGGTAVDPATSGNQATIIGHLDGVEGLLTSIDTDQATAAGQATIIGHIDGIEGQLTTIDAVLDSIKDTDGIKKITDQLPAGTNEIGKVAQGTKAAGSAAWPQVLYDASGNAVAVILDNSIYRLETRSKLSGQVQGAGAEVNVTVIQDTETAAEKRLQTEARLAPGSTVNIGTSVPSNPGDLVIDFCKNGGSENMLVNGSVTPVNFDFLADPTDTLAINSLLLVFSANDFEFDGDSFGSITKLTNGILLQTMISGVTTTIFTVKQNEDYLRVPGRTPVVNNYGPKDILAVDLAFGGLIKLAAGSADKIRVVVQDNLTSIALKYLTATVYAVKG